jgi:hypothetical protein
MFIKINNINVNPESIASLKVERSRGARGGFHVQLYTSAGHNFSVSDEYKEKIDAEKELNRVTGILSVDVTQGMVCQPDNTEKDTAIEDLTKKLDELTAYTKSLEEDHAEKTKALIEADKTIADLNEKIAAPEKEPKKGGK